MKNTNGPDFRELLFDAMRWVIAMAASFALVAVLQLSYNAIGGSAGWSGTGGAQAGPGEIRYLQVDAPAAKENGVVASDAWAEVYPEIVASYHANGNNDYRISYLEEDPYLVNIYEGYGFAIDYTSAIGHEYCLEDVANTERPHPLANCLTCKTADFTKLVNDLGVQAYSMEFATAFADMSENVGCYNCHGNEAGNAGKLVVTHDYTPNSLGGDMDSIDASTLACGQCHIEYYFAPDTKATTAPYTSLATMNPDSMLAYYNELGFSDWTQESTGTGLLKAQHPEMETFLGEGGKHASLGLNCASCHMEVVTSPSGITYTSHELVSPLNSQNILDTCAQCHGSTDMAQMVHGIQDQVTAREREIGGALSDLNDKLTEAVASGGYTEEELDAVRDLYRSGQWYFDFVYVENSEGAHNSALANDCLDKAAASIEQALALLR